ncbi:hypothetical protein OU568_27055, partial [Escherichia coli]|nr:hypothetical protein [Escherichia coli]
MAPDRPVAPAGWGWPPDYPLGEITPDDLPELQLLQMVDPAARNAVITEAIRLLPYLRQIRPCHVVKRYGLS